MNITLKALIKMNIKKGLSLAEVLVTLGIIGTLVALTMPVFLTNTTKYDLLYKTAFQMMENVTSEMLSNSNLYYGSLNSPQVLTLYSFCVYSQRYLNIIGSANCTTTSFPAIPMYTTSNGMRWWQTSGFGVGTTVSFQVDLNGLKGPNIVGKDVLTINISSTGKVSPPVSPAIESTYVNH